MAGSAGSLQVILAQLQRLTSPSGSALFVIYHRQENAGFRLEDFAGGCRMRVAPAAQGSAVQANAVHYPSGSSDLEVRGGRLAVVPPTRRHHPNIDLLLASLAAEYGPRVLAVLLSGMGTDGLQGLRDIRAAGGRTLVQDPVCAKFPQLPSAAADAGLADRVVGIVEMQRAIEAALAPGAALVGDAGPARPRPQPASGRGDMSGLAGG